MRVCICVCVNEVENRELECVFMLPVSLAVRTFNASLTVLLSFFRFDNLDNEDELPRISLQCTGLLLLCTRAG